MRVWYLSREGALEAVPFPMDAPVARVGGPDPLRLLLIGNGAASGWGVRSHDLAMTGHLARTVSAATGRGVQVDARVDRTRRLADLDDLLIDMDLGRYDAVLLMAGMSDAVNLTPTTTWRDAMQQLLDRFAAEAPDAAVLVLGPQPVRSVSTYTGPPGAIAERHRLRLNRITAALCTQRGMGFFVLPAPVAPPGVPGHRSPGVYAEWAATIAPEIAALLHGPPRAPAGPQPEEARQRATEAMRPDAPADPHLDRITQVARELFGAEFAAVTMLDGDQQHYRSVAGTGLPVLTRASSMCDHTVRSDRPLVIGDLTKDARFDGNPAVHGDAHLRFYAGYPIESPDGYRVGALCVFGTTAREAEAVDTTALSDLALLVQKELWASTSPPAESSER